MERRKASTGRQGSDSKRRFFVRIKGKEEELVPQLKESYGEIEVVKVTGTGRRIWICNSCYDGGRLRDKIKTLSKTRSVHMIRIQD